MYFPPLSNRLKACCDFVHPGDRVADVGCDHGYLGIFLLLQPIAKSVIAADINQMPLDCARRNGEKYGVSDRMSFYLSDGAKSIPRDFDVLTCAGMGADTMISILEGSPWLQDSRYRLILQCQSRRPELRKYLYAHGYRILHETLAVDGKFLYPVMEVTYGSCPTPAESDYYLSPALLKSGSPFLPAFYHRVVGGLQRTVDGLARTGGEKYAYYRGILDELLKLEEHIHDNCG